MNIYKISLNHILQEENLYPSTMKLKPGVYRYSMSHSLNARFKKYIMKGAKSC